MKTIGGFFANEPCMKKQNGFFQRITPTDGDIRFMMSGRCGNYYALQDIALNDTRRVAYVPAYTCETVLAPFEKAGFKLCFYQVSRNRLTPVFDPAVLDQISLISICGYYGFSSYDSDFLQQCHEKKIIILEDTTHSIFSSDGIHPLCDYVVGSLRKWIGVPAGGFAIKTHGHFALPVLPPDEGHLSMRRECMRLKEESADFESQESSDTFWEAEMMLRQIFSSYGSDEKSSYVMEHFPVDDICSRRRNNYAYLLQHFPAHAQIVPVYPDLPGGIVPSHFTIYTDKQESVKNYLKERGISSTVYWPQSHYVNGKLSSDTEYVYQHVLSLPCDQRYGEKDMDRICCILRDMPLF